VGLVPVVAMGSESLRTARIERPDGVALPLTLTGLLLWSAVYSTALFLFANVRTIDAGAGYVFLLPAVGFTVLALLVGGDALRGIVLRPSAVALLPFLIYFLVKLLIDLPDSARMRSYSIGTDGGVVFALLLGTMLGVLLARQSERRFCSDGALLAFLLACVVLAADTFRGHLGAIRTDIFLIVDDVNYQRPGNFVILTAIFASMQLALCWDARQQEGRGASWASRAGLAAYVALIALLLATTQLIGSNASFVVTAYIAVGTLMWCARPRERGFASIVRSLRELDPFRLLWRALPRFVLIGAVVAAAAFFAVVVFFAYTGLEARQFRIFGFGEREILFSLTDRFEILRSNFVVQFAHSPMLGDLRADELTTGPGSYSHSLISMFSHLGIVGVVLFAGYLTAVIREVRRPDPTALPFYNSAGLALHKLVIMAGVLGFACLGTFFTWLPLWWCLGFLYGPVAIRQSQVVELRYRTQVGVPGSSQRW
jgi:hypothetical protein